MIGKKPEAISNGATADNAAGARVTPNPASSVTFVARLPNQGGPITVWDAWLSLVRHPIRNLVWRWNWKSAVLSSLMRAGIFFGANFVAGWRAALGAAGAELALRALTSGFYGAVTEVFSTAEPRWAAMLMVMIGMPILNHSGEFLVHWLRGTPNLIASMTFSVIFTAISSAFNLYFMQRGILTVGPTAKTLWQDLCEIPTLLLSIATSSPRIILAWAARLSPKSEDDLR